jgi:pimeloyl-ACP methyl ester carboxylesterase
VYDRSYSYPREQGKIVKPLPAWFRTLIRSIGTAIPPIGSRIAWRLFWSLGTPGAVRPTEREFHETARRRDIQIAGKDVAVYEWGSGPTVLVVHGWRSRASRFALIATRLVESGYTVVGFDAPGNGSSTGDRTDAFEYIEAISVLGSRHGEFEAIIAHSFGALATLMAKRTGVRTKRIVTIAGVHDFDSIVTTFTRAIGLPGRATRLLRGRIGHKIGPPGFDIWREAVAELDPTDTTTPLFVIHDEDDNEVAVEQAMLIAEAHTGELDTLLTTGLGHNRILGDSLVVDRILSFIAGSKGPHVRTTQPDAVRRTR